MENEELIFTEELRQLTTNDPGHPETFNPLFGQLLENTKYLKKEAEDQGQQISDLSAELSQRSNPNLLINANFLNPVNQRGLTEYTTNFKYTIDRWYLKYTDSASVKITNRGVTLAGTTTNDGSFSIRYPLENSRALFGKKVVLSVKINKNTCGNFGSAVLCRGNGPNSLAGVYGSVNLDGVGVFSVVIDIPLDNGGYSYIVPVIQAYNPNSTVSGELEIEWVKLEPGEYATPFIPRTYAEELAMCKWYYRTFPTYARQRTKLILANQLLFYYTFPEMRVSPTVSNYNIGLRVTPVNSNTEITGFTFALESGSNKDAVIIYANKTAHGMTDAVLSYNGVAITTLDAEIY
ncbi:hypothetical protein [Cellulosilyticum sp. I15G10I2]|uniref:hypothetical protein n=1 Tax=Cellulosilyticum sp. I15G10I2 TaxID=1892843 RepID=UPI00085BF061|nr:hypothetical protein [Cellulosilyticum sp. I15G10I2]